MGTPVFLTHCENDDVVPIENKLRLRIGLMKMGIKLSSIRIRMEGIC